jgi:flagellar motor switch/type III secretory pathway protein FliN
MATFGPDIAAEVVSHCQLAVGEIAQAFTSALNRPIEVTIGEAEAFTFAAVARDLAGPGLAVVLQLNNVGAALLLPEASGLLPEWYTAPDATGQSKLDTLAQELGMLLLPAAFVAERFQSLRVARLATSLRAAGGADGTALVRLALKSAEQQGTGFLIWPLSDAENFFRTTSTAAVAGTARSGGAAFDESEHNHDDGADDAAWPETAAGEQATHAAAEDMPAGPSSFAGNSPQRKNRSARGPSLRDLPVYTRSLLKIRVPLSVTLAEKKQAVGQILELGPGSIIQFEKSCEEMLDLNVSNLPIARGEAVKVGEKFGLRVTSLILPGERFKTVRPAQEVAKGRT